MATAATIKKRFIFIRKEVFLMLDGYSKVTSRKSIFLISMAYSKFFQMIYINILLNFLKMKNIFMTFGSPFLSTFFAS